MSTLTETWKAVPRRRFLVVPAKWRNPIGIAGAIIVAFVILTALIGNLIWTNDPNLSNADRLLGPSWAHPFGTDEIGRDTLARIIHGAQVSLQVGATATAIALVAGTVLGMLAGYYKGIVDQLVSRVIDLVFAFPGLVLAIVIAGLLGPTRRNAMIAIGIIITAPFARVVRAAFRSSNRAGPLARAISV